MRFLKGNSLHKIGAINHFEDIVGSQMFGYPIHCNFSQVGVLVSLGPPKPYNHRGANSKKVS